MMLVKTHVWTLGEGKAPLFLAENRTTILLGPTRSLVTIICIEYRLEKLKKNSCLNKIVILRRFESNI
jgi:hypothetical protein